MLGSASFDEPREPVLVDLITISHKAVAGGDEVEARLTAGVVEQLAEVRHAHLDGVPRPFGLERRPQLFDEAIDAHDPGAAQDQEGQKGTLLRRRRRDVDVVDEHLQRSQHPERDPHERSV